MSLDGTMNAGSINQQNQLEFQNRDHLKKFMKRRIDVNNSSVIILKALSLQRIANNAEHNFVCEKSYVHIARFMSLTSHDGQNYKKQ